MGNEISSLVSSVSSLFGGGESLFSTIKNLPGQGWGLDALVGNQNNMMGLVSDNVPGVRKLAQQAYSGISKLNQSTDGALGKVWNTIQRAKPVIGAIPEVGTYAGAAITGGQNISGYLDTLRGKRTNNQNLTDVEEIKRGRID